MAKITRMIHVTVEVEFDPETDESAGFVVARALDFWNDEQRGTRIEWVADDDKGED